MLKQIPITKLVPGMYVNQVVKQSGKLKMRSKGLVKSAATITQLKQKGIELVEVDLEKSQVNQINNTPTKASKAPAAERPKAKKSNSEQFTTANDLYLQALRIKGDFIQNLTQGFEADVSKVCELSQHIIDSIFDNNNAIRCLTLIKNTDKYLIEHCINCSILMGVFARYLNFDKALIEDLSLGAMLMDIGMATIPTDAFQKSGQLSQSEWQIMRGHVDAGVELLEPFEQLSDTVFDIIKNHHERLDGSGYPAGKQEQSISTYARMAAIVDCFDAMTSNRHHQQGRTPIVVLRQLLKDPTLDASLVQQFVKCVGVHPIGSLVKLKSEKLALVSSLGKSDPLSPVVMTFYSLRSNTHAEIKRIDLSKSEDEIVASVKPDEFKMNLTKFFREIFIHQVP